MFFGISQGSSELPKWSCPGLEPFQFGRVHTGQPTGCLDCCCSPGYLRETSPSLCPVIDAEGNSTVDGILTVASMHVTEMAPELAIHLHAVGPILGEFIFCHLLPA